MNTTMLFLIEIAVCFLFSLVVILLLRSLLRDVLIDTCGNGKRAEFWVMFSHLMLIMAPLMLVIFFAPTEPFHSLNIAKEIKDALFISLLGNFIALSVIGRVIWKTAVNPGIALASSETVQES